MLSYVRIVVSPGPPISGWRVGALAGVLIMGVLFGVFVYFAVRRR